MEQRGALECFLSDMAAALLDKHRRLTTVTKSFYMTMLQHCGSMVHDWISDFLVRSVNVDALNAGSQIQKNDIPVCSCSQLGPDIRTSQRFRAATLNYPLVLGFNDDFFLIVKTILERWGLADCPFILSEDGTALQLRVSMLSNDTAQEVYLFGFNGTSYTVSASIVLTVSFSRQQFSMKIMFLSCLCHPSG